MKVLVCGGRDFTDGDKLTAFLDNYFMGPEAYGTGGIDMLIHGGARGADTLAGVWADANGIMKVVVPANWAYYGPRLAGPERNHWMLRLKPDLVIAFPGGSGTRHMVNIARTAGIEVVEVK